MAIRKTVAADLKTACSKCLNDIESSFLSIKPFDIVSTIQTRTECLAAEEKLIELGKSVRVHYPDVFSNILHVNDLPKDIYARIKLKNTTKPITTRSYSTL